MAFSLHNWVKFTNVREAKTTYSGVRKQISNIGHWSLRPRWWSRAAILCPKGGQVPTEKVLVVSIIHLITITTTTKTTTALYDIIIITKNNDNAHHHFGWWSSSKLLLMEEYIKY